MLKEKQLGYNLFFAAVILLNIISFIVFIVGAYRYYKFPFIDDLNYAILLMMLATIPAILSLIGFAFNFFDRSTVKIVIRIVLIILVVISISISIGYSWLVGFAGPFGSKTEDINNYLIVDSYVEKTDYKIFPDKIPELAVDVQYFYRYRYCVEADYDIYAEWKLPKTEFEAEKERILSLYPEVKIERNERNGKYIDYKVTYETNNSGYAYKFVSFSDSTLEVKYIFSETVDDANGEIKPYFLEMKK